ncbi:hypothetical protein ACULV4_000415 [Cronobacter dublinensis]
MLKYKSSIYSDESDLYTALQSNKAKITDLALRKLALRRGIIYSSIMDRDDLIDAISELPFSYSQLQYLTDRLTPKIRREQYSVKRIAGLFKMENLNDVLSKLNEKRIKFKATENIIGYRELNRYAIEIDYTEYDFGRGKYQQKKRYGGWIEFINQGNYYSVRYTYTTRIANILNEILQLYSNIYPKDKFEIIEVDLSSISESFVRNKFTEGLFKNNSQILFMSVQKVRISKVKTILDDEMPLDEDLAYEDELDDDILPHEDLKSDENASSEDDSPTGAKILNANFDGEFLDSSEDIGKFINAGFYRSRIKWQAKAIFIKNSPVLTIELAFNDRHYGRDLKFRIAGIESVLPGDDENDEDNIYSANFDKVFPVIEDMIYTSYDALKESVNQKVQQGDSK